MVDDRGVGMLRAVELADGDDPAVLDLDLAILPIIVAPGVIESLRLRDETEHPAAQQRPAHGAPRFAEPGHHQRPLRIGHFGDIARRHGVREAGLHRHLLGMVGDGRIAVEMHVPGRLEHALIHRLGGVAHRAAPENSPSRTAGKCWAARNRCAVADATSSLRSPGLPALDSQAMTRKITTAASPRPVRIALARMAGVEPVPDDRPPRGRSARRSASSTASRRRADSGWTA